MSELANSRHLPARYERMLSDLYRPMAIDVRNKTAIALIKLGFAAITDEGKRANVVIITDLGKTALERNKRGVDPFIMVTP